MDLKGDTDFQPTKSFFIVPHYDWTKDIRILDLTALMTEEFGTDKFSKEAKRIVKQSPPNPYIVASKKNWYSTLRTVRHPGKSDEVIAEWEAGCHSMSTTSLTFPPDSTSSSHQLSMKTTSFWSRGEAFVVDSVPYVWKVKDWASRKFELYKTSGRREQEIGKYWQGWSCSTGGILVLNDHEVNDVVGIITCLVMLWKRRQRNWERRC